MKHGYYGIDSSKLINNYKIEEDKIIITYLDYSTEELPYTKETENIIINKMLEQAIERDNSSTLNDASAAKNMSVIFGSTMGLITVANVYGLYNNLSDYNNMLFGTLALITGTAVVTDLMILKKDSNELDELKKYRLYLSIRKELEEQNNININTIDNYSLKDIKRLKKNLGKN